MTDRQTNALMRLVANAIDQHDGDAIAALRTMRDVVAAGAWGSGLDPTAQAMLRVLEKLTHGGTHDVVGDWQAIMEGSAEG